MRFYELGFIGEKNPNVVTEWVGGDNYENLSRQLKEMPFDWRYRDSKIFYRYNELGHRSKPLKDLNLDNYILVTGCSHTQGLGVEEDKIYGHVLAQKLNCDYYNLGLAGTGIDVVLHNLVIWFSTVSKLPKLVVIQWPDETRTLTGSSVTSLHPRGLWEKEKIYSVFVDLAIKLKFFEAKKMMAHQVILAMIKVPIIYFGIEKVIPFNDQTIIEPVVDRGRDVIHPGVLSHENFANSIYERLINNECLNFYQNTEQKS